LCSSNGKSGRANNAALCFRTRFCGEEKVKRVMGKGKGGKWEKKRNKMGGEERGKGQREGEGERRERKGGKGR